VTAELVLLPPSYREPVTSSLVPKCTKFKELQIQLKEFVVILEDRREAMRKIVYETGKKCRVLM